MTKPESSREAVLRVMRDGVARTDADIERVTGLSHSKVSGARSALWEAGLVERLDKDDRRHWLWRLCPPERQEEARRAFRDSTERRTLGRLQQKSAAERANIVVHLLGDEEVNEALLAQLERGKTWRRARARSRNVRADLDAERRARKSELRRAMDEAGVNAEFLQTRAHLRDLIDVLFVMQRHIEIERERSASGLPPLIPPSNWGPLARNVREVLEAGQVLFRDIAATSGQPMDSCPLCGDRLHDLTAQLDEGYVEAEAIEIAEDA